MYKESDMEIINYWRYSVYLRSNPTVPLRGAYTPLTEDEYASMVQLLQNMRDIVFLHLETEDGHVIYVHPQDVSYVELEKRSD